MCVYVGEGDRYSSISGGEDYQSPADWERWGRSVSQSETSVEVRSVHSTGSEWNATQGFFFFFFFWFYRTMKSDLKQETVIVFAELI